MLYWVNRKPSAISSEIDYFPKVRKWPSCYDCYWVFQRGLVSSLFILNKRAQRALGRSPEEKVKGHSVANNREPQGHNLNNFGRGPFDDVIY